MSFNSSLHHMLTECFESRTTTFISTAMLLTNILLLLPLLFFVFYLGLQRWRQQRSSCTGVMTNNSDFFTYNMAALELISMFGSCFYCFGNYMDGQSVQWVGDSIFYLTAPGQSLFHLLTCVDRYLAVVHPITYLGLRQAGGVRNIITGCVWLLCLVNLSLTKILRSTFLTVTNSSVMVFSFILVSFCSFSVLRVLNHPGPGEVRGDRKRVDQLKQRAFQTIVVIMVAQLLRLIGVLICSVMSDSSVVNDINCAVGLSSVWLAVPCGLVLPLLFLQRAGKLPACKQKTDQEKNQIRATCNRFNEINLNPPAHISASFQLESNKI